MIEKTDKSSPERQRVVCSLARGTVRQRALLRSQDLRPDVIEQGRHSIETQCMTRSVIHVFCASFAIDAEARAENMDHAARHALRLNTVPALLDDIRAQILAAQKSALPNSATGKATHYTLALWRRLICFLDHPELELSNNLAENSMRPIAIGRKNWIHVGSAQAGPKIAAILSVVESCRRLRLPIRDYLAAVLPGLANRSIHSLDKLTPTAFAKR